MTATYWLNDIGADAIKASLMRILNARRRLLLLGAATLALLAACSFGGIAQAAKLQVLFSFKNLRGTHPISGLIGDSAGNFYGTTPTGGTRGDGVVFELSPPTGGKKDWTETVLHAFHGTDGSMPYSGLLADGAGDLYGATGFGGRTNDGVVFELSPSQVRSKGWTEKVLYEFRSGNGGSLPAGILLADRAGNLYGTTSDVGGSNSGVVFELSPPTGAKKAWTETVLYAFDEADGGSPRICLIDNAGNLYGTASGSQNDGLVFELSPPVTGQTAWTEVVLHSFDGTDGQFPSGLTADALGNLYGTAAEGGQRGADCKGVSCGVAFELSPPVAGQTAWTETVIRSFRGTRGGLPVAGVILDGAGNLYGTARVGGTNDRGVVFELSPPVAGRREWTETVLYSFDVTHGWDPLAGLIEDGEGSLYGTTADGGANKDGIAFRLTP